MDSGLLLGLSLDHGGHLTHGSPVTYMAKLYNFVRYGMKDPDTGEIDYDAMLEVAKKERPKIVLAGFSAYPRELDWKGRAVLPPAATHRQTPAMTQARMIGAAIQP